MKSSYPHLIKIKNKNKNKEVLSSINLILKDEIKRKSV
jgi:hypothetical protein